MARYVDSVLLKNEKVMFGTSLHWIVYSYGLVVTIAGGLLSFYGADLLLMLFGTSGREQYAHPLAIITACIVGLGCFMVLIAYVTQISTELAITNRRVIAKFGFISRTTFELFLNKVEGANIDQDIMGRLCGYGSVLVKGTGGGISPIHNVTDPAGFQRQLMRQIQRVQGNDGND
ncbi:MAG: PH domain-containing protein [Alphaproteobacteria bacterium]|nr:PH domain-containing protein [Alphaproteobacteria bacterium]